MGKLAELFTFKRSTRLSDDAYALKLKAKNLTATGEAIVSSTPMAPPIGYKKQPSMVDIVREQIRGELSRIAAEQDMETFEESEDFDVDDDGPLMPSPWENDFDPSVAEAKAALEEHQARTGGAGGSPPAPGPAEPPAAEPPTAKPPEV